MMKIIGTSILYGLIIYSHTTGAITLSDLPMEPLYFDPPIIERDERVQQLTCVGLDKAIIQLQPYRYTYKAPFYRDKANVVATTLILTESIPILKGVAGIAYFNYSSAIEERERRRQLLVEQQMTLLQRLKAEKYCFE